MQPAPHTWNDYQHSPCDASLPLGGMFALFPTITNTNASVSVAGSTASATLTSASRNGTWIPCTCACSDFSQDEPTTAQPKSILVRIAPIAITNSSAHGFCAHLADPSSGKVWVDLVDSLALLQERKSAFAPRLLIPLDQLSETLAQTLADADITNPDNAVSSKRKIKHGFPNGNSNRNGNGNGNGSNSNKMQMDVEWIQLQKRPDQPLALVHLKCTERTVSDQRFTWTFIASPLDPPQAAQVLTSELLEPLLRVLHWQILETNHLSFQLDQATRDLAFARSLLPDPTAIRERTFPPVYIPKDRRDIDYVTVFGNRTRWAQALNVTHPAVPSHPVSNPSRPPPPNHAQSQPVFSLSNLNPLSGAVLSSPRAVHSSPTLGPSNVPSSDIGHPLPVARLRPPVQNRASLPPRTAMLELLLSSSQSHPPLQSQCPLQTLHSDPYSPLPDRPLPSSSPSDGPTTSLFKNTPSSGECNPSAVRPVSKSPITLKLTDSQSQSQSQLPATEPSSTPPPPPMSPRSLIASLPPSLVIPTTIPVSVLTEGPPSSQCTAPSRPSSTSTSASVVTPFAIPKSPARALKRSREDESGLGAGKLGSAVGSAKVIESEGETAMARPKRKQKLKGLF